jgi:alpha-tubulin suppressor-like RCC1 family protein
MLSGFARISAGASHACAVTAQGGVECWGHNPYGELGDGSTKDSSVPVRVRGF